MNDNYIINNLCELCKSAMRKACKLQQIMLNCEKHRNARNKYIREFECTKRKLDQLHTKGVLGRSMQKFLLTSLGNAIVLNNIVSVIM